MSEKIKRVHTFPSRFTEICDFHRLQLAREHPRYLVMDTASSICHQRRLLGTQNYQRPDAMEQQARELMLNRHTITAVRKISKTLVTGNVMNVT